MQYSQQYTARTNENTVTRFIVLTGLEVWRKRWGTKAEGKAVTLSEAAALAKPSGAE